MQRDKAQRNINKNVTLRYSINPKAGKRRRETKHEGTNRK